MLLPARGRSGNGSAGVFAWDVSQVQRDDREGGENPPLPRNCKRVLLRPVIRAQEGSARKPLEPEASGRRPGWFFGRDSGGQRASQETGPVGRACRSTGPLTASRGGRRIQ
jgi:hypothetical protein